MMIIIQYLYSTLKSEDTEVMWLQDKTELFCSWDGRRCTSQHRSAIWLCSLGGATANLVGISFCRAITAQFCFTYSLEGVTAMPCGLHARLCHAFLIIINITNNSEWILVTCNKTLQEHFTEPCGVMAMLL